MSLFEDFSHLEGNALDDFFINRYETLIGIDEAGRGPLAGPVVACALAFKKGTLLPGLNDSKKLSEKQRLKLMPLILENAHQIGVGMAFPEEIDRINIYQATLNAMRGALHNTRIAKGVLLIDGLSFHAAGFEPVKLIKGDAKSPSIMAASIVAKTLRDRLMNYYHTRYPQYGFNRHKGYGTALHLKALEQYGPCPLHRQSFSPVKEMIHENQNPESL